VAAACFLVDLDSVVGSTDLDLSGIVRAFRILCFNSGGPGRNGLVVQKRRWLRFG